MLKSDIYKLWCQELTPDTTRLSKDISALQKNKDIVKKIRETIHLFEQNHAQNKRIWFNELCFCLLTANAGAKRVLEIWEELCQKDAFLDYPLKELSENLKQKRYRFYNKRAEYIVEARKVIDILKTKILSFDTEFKAREWLISEVKGLGLKESSHFLRNVGYKNLAILDRHILRILAEEHLIQKIPAHLSKQFYYSTEAKMQDFADKVELNLAELDLFLWYLKTGMILK